MSNKYLNHLNLQMSSNNPNSYQHGMINSRQNGLGWPPRGNSNNIIHNRISAGSYSNNLHPHDMRPMMNYSQMGYRGPSMGNHYRFYNFHPRGMGPRTLTHFGSIGPGRSRSSLWYQNSTISNLYQAEFRTNWISTIQGCILFWVYVSPPRF